MLTITIEPPNLDEYLIVPAGLKGRHWIRTVPGEVRTSLQQANDVRMLFNSGRRLAASIAPRDVNRNPDLWRLRRCLQAESELRTNDPATPWELMAWGDVTDQRFWAVEKPVVRVHGKPLPGHNLLSGRPLRSRLVVASDPDGDLGLLSTYRARIKGLVLHSPDSILWNPSRNKLVLEMAAGYDLVVFIGHATYDPDDPYRNKYHLISGDHLIPNDLRINLDGQPVVLFIACVAAQHTPQGSGPAAMPALGFMPACLDRGAVAFIGPLWEIKVDGGIWLAECLLQHLQSNPPGEALRLTRRDALQKALQDVTWAAFVVYQRHLLTSPSPPPSPGREEELLWQEAITQYKQRDFPKTMRILNQLEMCLLSKVRNS